MGLRILQAILLLIGCALLLQTAAAAWEGPADNKPETELQAMDDPTLAWEAQSPCVNASITTLVVTQDTIAKRKAALRYLASLVVMKRKKDGKVPPWLYELLAQAENGAAQGCNDIAKNVYLSPETSPGEQDQQQAQDQSAQGKKAAKKKK